MTQTDVGSAARETAGAAMGAAAEVGSTAKDDAAQVATTATTAAADVARTATSQVSEVAGEAAGQVRDVAREVKTQVAQQATDQTQKLAASVRSLAEELEAMAGAGSDGLATAAVGQVADRARQVAGFIENRQPGDLVDELRTFARRRPGAFLIGALGLGVLAGRATRGVTEVTGGGTTELGSGGQSATAQGQPLAGVTMSDPYPTDSGAGTGTSTMTGTDYGAVTSPPGGTGYETTQSGGYAGDLGAGDIGSGGIVSPGHPGARGENPAV